MKQKDLQAFSWLDNTSLKQKVYHDLPDIFGLSIADAFINWEARTDNLSAKSFINYIRSKGTGVTVITESDYLKLKP